jgi:hypothetical protein
MFKQSCICNAPLFPKAFGQRQRAYLTSGAKAARDIAPSFLRCFSTADGEKVLAWLHSTVTCTALGPESTDEMLRYREGQRQLVLQIERLIAQAKSGS